MIPPYILETCKSLGEKAIFDRFRNDPHTSGWRVMHSIGVAKHATRISGEIDFVVVIPEEGILCIEVKAGTVSRENGIWKYGSGPFAKKSTVGPFLQASEAMHSIRNYVAKSAPSLRNILFFSAVFFTSIDFDEQSTEWHRWQFIDRSGISNISIAECCLRIIRSAHKYIKNVPSAKWYSNRNSRPNVDQTELIVNLLRGDFEYYVSPCVALADSENKILKYTNEQFAALDSIDENPRVLFKGPAGTGKTLLAIEAAKRAVINRKKVIFICYNNLLSYWLKKQTEPIKNVYNGSLTVGTIHSIFLSLSGLECPDNPDSDFWQNKLPYAVIEKLINGNIGENIFDKLIIDEAQDILYEQYLDVLDLLLDGGLQNGSWLMFGDFERQAIYSVNKPNRYNNKLEIIKKHSKSYFNYSLRINCRNTKQIAVAVELTSKMKPGYTRILHSDDQMDFINTEINFFESRKQQVNLLKAKVLKLKKYFKPPEIIVLSTKSDNLCCAAELLDNDPSFSLKTIRNQYESESLSANLIGYSSIQSFKGLEAQAVIITDVYELSGKYAESLLYIGMSRAKFKLIVFFNENCRDTYVKSVREGFLFLTDKGGH